MMTTEELFEKYPEILVYDFEVFRRFWCVVIVSAEGTVVITDQVQFVRFYDSHRDCIWIGYNSNHYDKYILGAVYNACFGGYAVQGLPGSDHIRENSAWRRCTGRVYLL